MDKILQFIKHFLAEVEDMKGNCSYRLLQGFCVCVFVIYSFVIYFLESSLS